MGSPGLDRLLTRRGRWASFAVTAVVVLGVAIPLAIYSSVQWNEGRVSSRVDDVVAEWDSTLTVDDVSVDYSESPLQVDVAVSEPRAPRDPDSLATLLSEREGGEVAVALRYTALLTGAASHGG